MIMKASESAYAIVNKHLQHTIAALCLLDEKHHIVSALMLPVDRSCNYGVAWLYIRSQIFSTMKAVHLLGIQVSADAPSCILAVLW